VLNLIALQGYGGLVLIAFVAWQLSTGLRWIRLGKHQTLWHRRTGITFAVIASLHMLSGLYLAFGLFAGIFGKL
jgi:hypothetical protein